MYRVQFLKEAADDLSRLDKPVARRVVERITWLKDNFEMAKPVKLSGDLAGFYKLRIGDYRVIYQILRKDKILMIHAIGHRKDIYRQR